METISLMPWLNQLLGKTHDVIIWYPTVPKSPLRTILSSWADRIIWSGRMSCQVAEPSDHPTNYQIVWRPCSLYVTPDLVRLCVDPTKLYQVEKGLNIFKKCFVRF